VRYKTNFVVCFLSEDDTCKLETFPLSKAGISRFTSELRKEDAVAVEAGAEHLLLLRPNQNLCWSYCSGRYLSVCHYRRVEEKNGQGGCTGFGAFFETRPFAGSSRPI
jgi:hypothetical protein